MDHAKITHAPSENTTAIGRLVPADENVICERPGKKSAPIKPGMQLKIDDLQ